MTQSVSDTLFWLHVETKLQNKTKNKNKIKKQNTKKTPQNASPSP